MKNVKDAMKEINLFRNEVNQLNSLSLQHPVDDATDEITIVLNENENLDTYIRQYHEFMGENELSYFSDVRIYESDEIEDVLEKILEDIITGRILGGVLMTSYKDIKHTEVTGRCFKALIEQIKLEHICFPLEFYVKNEGTNKELDELIKTTLQLLDKREITERIQFKNAIINEIIEYYYIFHDVWEDLNAKWDERLEKMKLEKEQQDRIDEFYLEE